MRPGDRRRRAPSSTTPGRDAAGINRSDVHTDVMIGSPELEVDGVDAQGRAVPNLRGGAWVLG